MEGDAKTGTHTRDASFSSYLNRAEGNFVLKLAGSVQTPNPLPATKTEEGEISVFGAEKYFNMMLEDDGPRIKDYDTSKLGQKKEENRGGQKHKQPKSRPGTPSTCSEASWNSQSGLLPSLRTPSQSKKKKRNGKINIFSGLSCNGSCSDKKSIYIHEMNAGHGGRGNKDYRKQNVGNFDHNPVKQLQPRFKARDEVYYSSFERSNKEERFAFANLNSGAKKLAAKSQLEEKKMKDEDPRKSLEVFGSQSMKGDNVAINLERRLSMLKWDAIPKAPMMNEDAGSDASSDLFEIESLSGNGIPMASATRDDSSETGMEKMAVKGRTPAPTTTGKAVGVAQRLEPSMGGSTVGSMGSHDPLEAMEITFELLVRPLGAAGATSWSCTPRGRRNV